MEHVCTSLQDWGDTRLATAIAAAFTAAAAAAVAAAAAHYVLERGAIRWMDLSNSEGAIEAPRDAISHRDAISLRQLVQRELLGEMGAQLGEVKCLLIVGTHTLRPAEAYSGLQRSAVVSSQLWQPAILRAPPSSSELLRAPPSSSELLRAPPSSSETLLRAPPSSFSELLLRAPPSSSETLLRAPPSSSELLRAPPSSFSELLRDPSPSFSELLLLQGNHRAHLAHREQQPVAHERCAGRGPSHNQVEVVRVHRLRQHVLGGMRDMQAPQLATKGGVEELRRSTRRAAHLPSDASRSHQQLDCA